MKELLLISGLGVLAMAAGLFNLRKLLLPLVIIGLLGNIAFCIADWNSNEVVYGMLTLDNYALSFTIIFSVIAILWFISATDYFEDENNFSDHYALVLFTLTGGFLLVSFSNMVMLFLGIEILSIPLFVLVGSNKTQLKSNEAAFKYFLLGSFASAFMLFGIALIYGSTGSFNLAAINTFAATNGVPAMMFTGMLLMLAAMAFKVSAAPFHFWAPDVYQGAPTNITAYMATVVKTVAFAAFFRLFQSTFATMQTEYMLVMSIIAALTLLISNITAAVQTDVKRMLAYSSISHAGFMMIAVLTISSGHSANLLLYYTLAYSISSITAFAVFKQVKIHSNGESMISTFKGLIKRNPLMTVAMTLSLLSMSGIPPLAGFIAKYLMFTAAVSNGYTWLVVIGIIASLVAVYYYFKIIIAMFSESKEEHDLITLPFSQRFLLLVCSIGMILLSVFPDVILSLL